MNYLPEKDSDTAVVIGSGVAGLAAAIPAVIFYNYFLNRSKTMVQEMENFSAGFLNIVERYINHK